MDKDTPGVVYLLHFDKKLKHAGHYMGWTTDLKKRLREHRSGRRERCVLTSVLCFKGIGWRVVRLWDGPLSFEKELKRKKNNRLLCPVCNVKVKYDRRKLRKYNTHNSDKTL